MTLTLSVFNDRSASAITPLTATWDDICARFANPPEVGSKAECILFSACEFGDKRTENGSLRSNDNVSRVWAAVGDYDGEKVQPNEAVALLHAAGVRALVYTSPSHEPHAPRWRVVAPFDTPGDREKHIAAVERLNTIIGGGLSSESFTLSQPFYIGRVKGKPFGAWSVAGRSIEEFGGVRRTPWRGSRNVDGSYRVPAETLLDDLRAGVEIHPAIVALAARGYSAEELSEIVEKYGPHWPRPERAEIALREDIPRAVKSWERKKTRELEIMLERVGVPPVYEPAAPRRSRFHPISHFTADPKPLEWLIDGLIEHPTFTAVFGESGAGKSYVTVDWALSIAAGRAWQGRQVKRVPVVYFCGEGHTGMNRRYKAWLMKNGLSEKDVSFYATDRAWSLIENDTFLNIIDDLDALPERPGLIVIDTYTRHAPGLDQNSSKEVPDFVRRCDDLKARYGCTVVLVAHSGLAVKDRIAGSHTLKGTLDAELAVFKNGKGRIRVEVTKMKDGEPQDDMFFKFETVTLPWVVVSPGGTETKPQTSSVLVHDDTPPVDPEKDSGGMNKAARVLVEVLQQVGQFIEKDTAREEFRRLYGSKTAEAGAKAFNRALKGMIESGKVIHDEERDELKLAMFAVGVPPQQPDRQ